MVVEIYSCLQYHCNVKMFVSNFIHHNCYGHLQCITWGLKQFWNNPPFFLPIYCFNIQHVKYSDTDPIRFWLYLLPCWNGEILYGNKYCGLIIFCGHQFFVDYWKLACSWIFNFMVLMKSTYKPIENSSIVEHLISWFSCNFKIHENWYLTKINESKVILQCLKEYIFMP